ACGPATGRVDPELCRPVQSSSRRSAYPGRLVEERWAASPGGPFPGDRPRVRSLLETIPPIQQDRERVRSQHVRPLAHERAGGSGGEAQDPPLQSPRIGAQVAGEGLPANEGAPGAVADDTSPLCSSAGPLCLRTTAGRRWRFVRVE